MKRIKKLSIIFVLFSLLSVCAVCATAFAAEEGSSFSNPIVMTQDVEYTKSWDYYNDSSPCYNEITLSAKGFITFEINKAMDDYGDSVDFELELYDKTGYIIWESSTYYTTSFTDSYVYTIPLDKGTYYMNVLLDEYLYSDEYVQTTYKYTFTKSNYWEIEPNGKNSQASSLKLDYMFKAIFMEDDNDYFKFDVSKGKTYVLKVDEFEELDYEYVNVSIYDSYGNPIQLKNEKISGTVTSWQFVAPSTGTYYISFTDGLNDFDVAYRVGVYLKKISASSFEAKLSSATCVYNGKVRTPSVTVKDNSGKSLIKDTDYTVEYENGRKNVGEYDIVIKYIGAYTGSKTLKFKILPASTKITSLTAATEGFTAKWSKVTTQTTGYEIQYSSKSNFSTYKTVKIASNSTTSKKVTSLTGNKKYYVRMRTYKTVDGTTLYSSWSDKKSVTTKPAIGVKLKSEETTIYVGGSKSPTYTVYPTSVAVKWKTSDSSIAKVSSAGKVTALKKGTATITVYFKYKDKTYKDTIKVTVKNPSISLSKTSATVYKWNTLALKATTAPTSVTVKWKSSNTSVAKVSSKGVVTAVKAGTATITASFTYGSKTYSKTCTITVKNQNPIEITYVDWYINSADGVEPEITIKNNTNKDIKYIEIETSYKNRFADPVYCDVWYTDSRILEVTSGLAAKQTKTFYWDPVIYNDQVSRIDFDEVTVTFIDNTVATFYLDVYWYDSNYYY